MGTSHQLHTFPIADAQKITHVFTLKNAITELPIHRGLLYAFNIIWKCLTLIVSTCNIVIKLTFDLVGVVVVVVVAAVVTMAKEKEGEVMLFPVFFAFAATASVVNLYVADFECSLSGNCCNVYLKSSKFNSVYARNKND